MRAIVLVVLAALLAPSVLGAVPTVQLLVDGRPADRLDGIKAGLATPHAMDATWPGAASVDAMGDATGDGRADALIVHFPVEETDAGGSTLAFRALSGFEGTFLWLTEFSGVSIEWLAGTDFDGDGLTDVLVTTLSYGEDVPTDAPLPAPVEWTWTITVLRGLNGQTIWTRTQTGQAVVAEVALANFFAPSIGGDADGDGGADIWLNVLDTIYLGPGAIVDRFELLSGATGEAIATLPLAAVGSAIAFPMDDVDGDGLADTLATIELGGSATLVAAIAGGRPVWVTPFAAAGVAFPLVDITGDQRGDAVFARDDDAFEFLDALDGSVLWEIVDPPFLGVLPGNVDGAGGADVVFLDAAFDGASGEVKARTLALSGHTGAELYDTRPFGIPLPANGFASVELRLLGGDMNGDKADEIIFNAENGPFLGRERGDIRIVDAATGALHWSRLGTDLHGRAIGDVTGDGRADILQMDVPLDQSSWGYGVVDGPTGSLLWSDVALVDGVTGIGFGDVDGDDAREAAFLLIDEAQSWLDVRDGASGSLLWDAP